MQQDEDQDALFDFEQAFSINDAQFNILPEQIHCNLKGEESDQYMLPQSVEEFPEDWQNIAKDLQEQIQKILFTWKVKKLNKICSFHFNLPPSYFKKRITIFEKLNDNLLVEYNEVSRLTREQIEQIAQTGTFDVPSKIFPIPYVWQISSTIIKGVKYIEQAYHQTLSLAYSIYYKIPQIIKGEKDHVNGFHLTIVSGLNNIVIKPLTFLGIIIGFREMDENEHQQWLYHQLEYKRQLRLQQLNVQRILYECFKYKDAQEYDQAKKIHQQMISFAEKFNQKAQLLTVYLQNLAELTEMKLDNKRLTVEDSELIELISNLTQELDRISAEIEDFYKANIDVNYPIEQQIQNHIMTCQEIYWQKSKYEPLLIKQLVSLTTCNQTLGYYTDIRDKELNKQVGIFLNNLKIKHPIKSLCQQYFDDEVFKFRKQIKKTLNVEMRQSIEKELKQLNVKEVEIYLDYYQHCKEEKQIIKKKIQNKEHITIKPLKKIECMRHCFPPYKVIYERNEYRLEREIYYKFDTSFQGWRLYLTGLTWYTWAMNVMFWLFANAISASFGLRALFSLKKFHPDVTINQRTGQVSPGEYSVTPVYQIFQQVLEGMRKSRESFEAQPDTGLFGKNLSRIYNYIEVYVFRFLFVGILIVCTLMPIGILANSIISLILAITAFAWMPIIILLTFLTKIFIFDWDVGHPRNKLIMHGQLFPFFQNIYHFLINGVLQFIISLLLIFVISPLSIIMISLYAILKKYTRLLYDKFMMIFIKVLGRVPASENNLAWRIAGPRISRRHFYGVSLDQAIILIAGQLERIILNNYKTQMASQITAPSKKIEDTLQKFFKLFSAQISFNDRGVNILIEELNDQINEQLNLSPRLGVQVRFKEDELVVLLKEAKKFIKKQMILKQLNDYIWKFYHIRQGDYNSLVEKIVMDVFGNNILEPLEDIDMRFTLKEEDTHNLRQKITRALKGQINLEIPERYNIQEIATDQKTVQKKFENFSNVINEAYKYQQCEQNWSSIKDKASRFYMNVCLK